MHFTATRPFCTGACPELVRLRVWSGTDFSHSANVVSQCELTANSLVHQFSRHFNVFGLLQAIQGCAAWLSG